MAASSTRSVRPPLGALTATRAAERLGSLLAGRPAAALPLPCLRPGAAQPRVQEIGEEDRKLEDGAGASEFRSEAGVCGRGG
jgi:hypothetical protein